MYTQIFLGKERVVREVGEDVKRRRDVYVSELDCSVDGVPFRLHVSLTRSISTRKIKVVSTGVRLKTDDTTKFQRRKSTVESTF